MGYRKKAFSARYLLTWEVYPIILVASFLRLYRLDTSAFSGDQSTLFRLAYDAVHQGLIPATSNGASIPTMHPPMAVYLLMLPALFSSDPWWAAAMTALFNIIAVLLAYIFTRRYFGRLAAAIAALLYATAETTIVFSRFIWQPNLLAPFTLLFLFALFWGVVERRKGWLFPALFLLGVMYQLHELTLLLVIPLLVAVLLAPGTIRLRDLALALVSLLIIFAAYIVWEVTAKFADVYTLLGLARAHAHIDTQALTFYQRLLNSYYYDERFLGSSYYDPIGSASSAVFKLLPLLMWSHQILVFLLFAGFVTAGALVVRFCGTINQAETGGAPAKQQANPALSFPGMVYSKSFLLTSLTWFRNWWTNLRDDPFRCGLLVLLVWQIAPVLLLSRHTAPVHQHYLLLAIPGPFILVGFFIARALCWFQEWKPAWLWRGTRYAIYALTALLLLAQLAGSVASLIDTVRGINSHVFGYNDIGSLQHALQEADQVAQERHLNRLYISISPYDDSLTGLPFLAEQMHTPATLFDATSCLLLPAPGAGPAVLLIRSSDRVVSGLLNHFATATLIDKPPLLGTTPFQLYVVIPAVQLTSSHNGFVKHLQLLDTQAQQLSAGASSFLVTRWKLLQSEQPRSRTYYTYTMLAKSDLPGSPVIHSDCMLTSLRSGDLLLATFRLPQVSAVPSSFSIASQFLVTSPYTITLGPLRFETGNTKGAPATLHAVDGSNTITITDDV